MARAAVSASRNVVSVIVTSAGLTSTAIRVAPGTSWRRSSNRFAANSVAKKLIPVRLPPGRARLARVFGHNKNDGDGRGRSLGCERRRNSACGNHRDAAANQIGCQFRQAIILIVGPAVLDGNVLALDEARFF